MATGEDLLTALRRAAEARSGLRVEADLDVAVGGEQFTVEGAGDLLRVRFRSLGAALGVARSQRGRLPELAGLLADAGLTAEVAVGGVVVALVGAEAAPGVPERLLSLGAVEVRAAGLLAAAVGGR